MTETNTQTTPAPEEKKPDIQPSDLKVERNGVSTSLVLYRIVKGPNKDKTYPAPRFSAETWEADSTWLGPVTIMDVLNTFVKRQCQTLFFDNVDPTTGQVNMNKFLLEVSKLTSTGMKLKEINEKLDELTTRQSELVQSFDPTNAAAVEEIKKLAAEILGLKAMAEERSRKKDNESGDTEAAIPVVA